MSQKEVTLDSTVKRVTIRANREQTVILRTAFAVSDIVSREVLQDIAVQTGLPPKWINKWFGRERSKLRNNLGKGRLPATALSPAEIVSVKSEFGDPRSSPFSDASGLDKSIDDSATTAMSTSSSGLKTAFPSVPANEHHFAMNIAPPKRSPMQPTVRGINQPTQRRPSNLIHDMSGSIYSPLPAAGDLLSSGLDSGLEATWQLPGSGFRTAPCTGIENAPPMPCSRTVDFNPANLEPAFPWSADLHIAQVGFANTSMPKDFASKQNIAQPSSSKSAPAHSIVHAHLLKEGRFIDPTKAPLKHLTELLSDFKDEYGLYSRLLVIDEDAKLRKILLDDISVDENPFLAAMALSLLAGLGFEW